MSTAIAHRPASVMKEYTGPVRDHAAAMQRASDVYFAALKRLQADYFERVKRITDAITQGTAPAEPVANGAAAEAPPSSDAEVPAA